MITFVLLWYTFGLGSVARDVWAFFRDSGEPQDPVAVAVAAFCLPVIAMSGPLYLVVDVKYCMVFLVPIEVKVFGFTVYKRRSHE